MKRVHISLLVLLGLFLAIGTQSQNMQLIDSLRKNLVPAVGEVRFKVLLNLAWEYRFAHPDSTIFFAQQAYDHGKSIGVKKDLATALNYIAIAHNYNGNRVAALDYHRKAIEVASEQLDSSAVAHAYNSIGRVYFEQGMMQRSVDYYVAAQKIFEDINDLSGMAYVYQSLGNLYRVQKDFKNTRDFYSRALALREKLGNKRNIMAGNVLLGRVYQDENQLDQAVDLFQKGYAIGRELGDEIQVAEIEIFLGQIYLKRGKLDVAESYCKEAYTSVQKVNNIRMLPWVNITLGEIYLAQQKDQKALECFNTALRASTSVKDAVSQRDSYYWLWKVAEKLKNKSQAMSYQNSFLIMRDSTSSLDLAREVDRLQFQLKMEKRDRENEVLKSAEVSNAALIKQQRLQNLVLIVAVVAVLAIVIILWINNKRRRKVNEKLALQNVEIRIRNNQLADLHNEKDTLMNIMVHDLKAPLNNIKGLTSLVAMDGTVNKDQEYYLKLISDATMSGLEMITDVLDAYSIESGDTISQDEIDIQDFLTHRVNAFRKTASEKNVAVNAQTDQIHLRTDKGYLSRILDNLISNAIKFSPSGTAVTVHAGIENGEIRFSIRDQGPGFSDNDKKHLFKKFKKLSARPTAGESSNGLGLAIVKILVDRLGGNIELISAQGEGSEFVIKLPVNN
jgi:signal transduction histidine kinase